MCRVQVGGVSRCCDHDHLLRCGQTVAPRYRILKAFQCIFRKKANVSLILKMSHNFQGCGDICPHVLATLAEHCFTDTHGQVDCYNLQNNLQIWYFSSSLNSVCLSKSGGLSFPYRLKINRCRCPLGDEDSASLASRVDNSDRPSLLSVLKGVGTTVFICLTSFLKG